MNVKIPDQTIDFIIYVLQVLAISSGFALLITVAVLAVPFLNAMEQKSKRKQFIKVLKNGISKQEITNSDLRHIAERWNQNRESVLFHLRVMLSDYFIEEDEDKKNLKGNEDKKNLKGYIIKLLEDHEKDEPFAELPRNISLQMNSIQKSLNEVDSDKIEQLASSLSLLYASNRKEVSKQNTKNTVGLFLTILGLFLAFVSFLPKLQSVFL